MIIASVYNPTFHQGDTWELPVSMSSYTPPTGSMSAYDLTGYVAKSQLRKRPDSSWVAAELDCSIPDPSGGMIYMTLQPSATSLVPAGTYSWDMQISGTSGTVSGNVYTILRGIATITPDTTRS